MKFVDHQYFHNIILEKGDKVKVFFKNGNDYYIGVVDYRRDWFAQDKTFYYIKTSRMVKDGVIYPTDQKRSMCIPAWLGLIQKVG